MNILVTGGLGTVGRGLVAELKQRGHAVASCDLFHAVDETAPSLEIIGAYQRCDVADFRQLEALFHTYAIEMVYHTAAEFGRWNGEDFYEQLWRTNAIGTKNIIRLQEQRRFDLVHFSSSEVYGDWPNLMTEDVLDEYPIRQLNDYAITKWVNEIQIGNSQRQFATRSVIVRLFNTYGPGEYYSPYRSVNCRFLYSALMGLPWHVSRGHKRTSTYLADTVRTLANIADNFKPGEVYNIGGDYEHTIEELSAAVLLVTGADPKLATIVDPEKFTTTRKCVDSSKAARELGHRNTVSLVDGLRLTAEWMRKVYDIK